MTVPFIYIFLMASYTINMLSKNPLNVSLLMTEYNHLVIEILIIKSSLISVAIIDFFPELIVQTIDK